MRCPTPNGPSAPSTAWASILEPCCTWPSPCSATSEGPQSTWHPTSRPTSTGLTDEEYLEVQAPALEAIVTAGHFPFVTTVFARLDADGFDLDATTLFEFGLHRLLDGLAAMVGMGQP